MSLLGLRLIPSAGAPPFLSANDDRYLPGWLLLLEPPLIESEVLLFGAVLLCAGLWEERGVFTPLGASVALELDSVDSRELFSFSLDKAFCDSGGGVPIYLVFLSPLVTLLFC